MDIIRKEYNTNKKYNHIKADDHLYIDYILLYHMDQSAKLKSHCLIPIHKMSFTAVPNIRSGRDSEVFVVLLYYTFVIIGIGDNWEDFLQPFVRFRRIKMTIRYVRMHFHYHNF